MKTTTINRIGMREFLRNPKKIKEAVAAGQSFEVLDRATPAFRVVPATDIQPKKYTLAELKNAQFKGGPADLAKNLDQYLYGKAK